MCTKYSTFVRQGEFLANQKVVRANFYKSGNGREPVREWLISLPKVDRATIGDDIRTVELGWPIGMPACRHLMNGLWEVRSNISDGRIARVLFHVSGQDMYLLHGFIKKTQKTPQGDLNLALRRLKEVRRYENDQPT
jgi:phage-related protein